MTDVASPWRAVPAAWAIPENRHIDAPSMMNLFMLSPALIVRSVSIFLMRCPVPSVKRAARDFTIPNYLTCDNIIS
ncbi:hypothetical protein Gain_0077_050 [Komagataeibacter intermedius TF2]|nr:hypothetical protein Gain_0077_050 [Komagataeibacter intermedius TF2]